MLRLNGLSDKISLDIFITLTEKDLQEKEERPEHCRLGVSLKLLTGAGCQLSTVYLIYSIIEFPVRQTSQNSHRRPNRPSKYNQAPAQQVDMIQFMGKSNTHQTFS